MALTGPPQIWQNTKIIELSLAKKGFKFYFKYVRLGLCLSQLYLNSAMFLYPFQVYIKILKKIIRDQNNIMQVPIVLTNNF